MSISENGWSEVERPAQVHEQGLKAIPYSDYSNVLNNMLTVSTEDRLRGAVVEALSQLEQGHPAIAKQILNDSLKIGGVK